MAARIAARICPGPARGRPGAAPGAARGARALGGALLRLGPGRQARALAAGPGDVSSVCVAGAGTLGTQVALQIAISGFRVSVLDVTDSALDKCRAAHKTLLQQYIAREEAGNQARAWRGLASSDKPASEVAAQALARLSYTTDPEEGAGSCDLVSENVPEVPEIKAATYANLSKHAPSHAIFTSNSSTLLPSSFAEVTGRPEKFCALHFANGIWDANIGEVMPHPGTDPAVTRTVLKFAKDIGMVPFLLKKEHNGYLINALLVPWLAASLTLVQKGASEPRDVDRAWLISMKAFEAPPGAILGPFQIMDIIGLPLVNGVMTYWGEQLKDEQMTANGVFVKEQYLDCNKLGIMNGDPAKDSAEGFYTYPNPEFMQKGFLS